MQYPRPSLPRAGQRGLSLVELLVAMVLGMVVVAALITLYANVSRSNNEMSKTSLLVENGRFAMQLLQEDVSHAGFWGPIDYITPTAIPDPCLAYAAWPTVAADLAAYKDNLLSIPVQGSSSGAAYAGCGSALANVVAKSDVLIVRHANRCTVDDPNCDRVTDTGPHVQVSGCRLAPTPEPAYVVETLAAMNARAPRIRAKDCATEVGRRRLIANIYFVANGATGIPTLMRKQFLNGAFADAEALVEGIEAFQVEYGLDTLGSNGLAISATNPGDGNADTYVSCSGTECTAAAGAAGLDILQNAVTVRLHILSRSLDTTPGYTDTKSYVLGDALAVAAANDGYKRHVFTSTVRLVNPSSRRESP
jgi:type IV pilus assembly protein PilW